VRVNFKAALANAAVRTGEAAVTALPGSALLAPALRGPAVPLVPGPMTPAIPAPGLPGLSGAAGASAVSTTAEGPGGASAGGLGLGGAAGDPRAALAESAQNEMDMLVLQQQVAAQQNQFTTMSNVLKSESDTERSAIQNIK
jgi:hypothetical protein